MFCVFVQSLEVLLQHPEDNRNQIRELAQTLMDGGVLDELIQQKLDAFNTRWDELMARVRHAAHSCIQKYTAWSHRGQMVRWMVNCSSQTEIKKTFKQRHFTARVSIFLAAARGQCILQLSMF